MQKSDLSPEQLLWGAAATEGAGDDVEIRFAGEHDFDAVLASRIIAMKELYNFGDEMFTEEFLEATAAYFAAGDQTTVIADSRGDVVGSATLCYIARLPTFSHPTGRRAHLMNVYTDPRFRGQGIATRMVQMLIDEAKNRGVSEITMDATDGSRRFCNRLGFSTDGEGFLLDLKKTQP